MSRNEAYRRLRLLRIGNAEEKQTPRQRTKNIFFQTLLEQRRIFQQLSNYCFLKLI